MAPLSILLLFLGASCRILPTTTDTSTPDDSGDTQISIDAGLLLDGMVGTEGALLWGTGDTTSGILERRSGESGTWSVVAEGEGPWWDAGYQVGMSYRLRAGSAAGEALSPQPLDFSLATSRSDALFYLDEDLALELALQHPASAPALQLELSRLLEDRETWLEPSCLQKGGADCWSGTATRIDTAALSTTFPEIPSTTDHPAQPRLTGVLWATTAHGDVKISTSVLDYIELGRRVAWGDVHAHSNLSNDGCEDVTQDCAERGGEAAEDFFQQAKDRGLDFTAITDHAEWLTYTPAGGEAIDIWTAQSEAAQNADGTGVVPILGYEWTDYGGHLNHDTDGGHKTVLLSTLDPCPAYRVGAALKRDPDIKPLETGIFAGGNTTVGTTPELLWEALDKAAEVCPPTRALTFFHHSAFDTPQAALWEDAGNTPDPRYETVAEIYSEHGCSECARFEDRDCDWRGKSNTAYVGNGGLQSALARGHRLGFVAGTDSHDGRPGSVEDAPSCTANTVNDAFICHDHRGGLTGVLYEGSLDRDAIFDAMFARSTLATSGPRLPVRAVLLGANGALYLPGSLVPAIEARTARLLVSVEGMLDEVEFSGVTIEVLRPDNSVITSTETPILDVDVTVAINEPFYVRIRLHNDQDGERLWLSPFFGI